MSLTIGRYDLDAAGDSAASALDMVGNVNFNSPPAVSPDVVGLRVVREVP